MSIHEQTQILPPYEARLFIIVQVLRLRLNINVSCARIDSECYYLLLKSILYPKRILLNHNLAKAKQNREFIFKLFSTT